jgi:hypothetical protein
VGSPRSTEGHFGPDVVVQLQPLLRSAQCERTAGLGDDRLKREVDLLDAQAPRLDTGKVEDVVDDGQQRLGGGLDRLQVFALLASDLGVEKQIRHADDAVHRRADLVAHVGEEVALGPARRLGGLLRLEQLDLAQLALGDVAVGALDP